MSTHNLVKSLRADRSQLASEVRQLRAEVERAKRALLSHGFTDCGGAEWKPPLGPHPGTLLAEVERLRALDKEAKSAFAPWVQGPGIVGGILHLQEEVERLRAEANARAVEELALQAEGCDMAASGWVCEREHAKDNAHRDRLESRIDQLRGVAFHIRKRIAELSKPAAKESEPSRCAERVWASGDMEACGKPLPCSDHSAKESEPAKDETKCGKVVAYVNGEPALCDAAKGHPFSCSRVVSVPKPVTGPNYLDQEEWGHAKPEDPAKGGEKIETWVDDWTVSLADEAKATHAEEPAEEASAKLLAMVVEGLCNLGREVRRGGKS